ncbi:MAG: AI-2E family transporter [Actinomycetota bacterium]|nr:AI-2E family transporter [Actinomycetota bacterium]
MSSQAVYRAIGLAAGLALATLVARQLLTLLLVVVLTIILSLPLADAASRAERAGLPRAAGALGALLAVSAVVAGIGYLLAPQFVSEVKQFAAHLPSILAGAQRYVHSAFGLRTGNLAAELNRVVQSYTHHPQRLIGPIEQYGGTVVVLIAGLVLVVLGAFLIAVNPEPLVNTALALVPARRRGQAVDVFERVRHAWLGWMTAVGVDMVVLGGLLFMGMTLVDLPFALGFAVLSALLTVIPNYGSVISAFPPIIAALSISPGKAALVLIVYLIVNQIEGNLILPLIMARTVDMHPAVVSIGLLVMAALFGLIGVLIAIPLVSLVMILVQTLWIEPQEAAASRA